MKFNGLTASIVAILLTPAALAAGEPHQEFVCVLGTETRIIGIFNQTAEHRPGCRVDYTKGGRTETLWTSSTSRAYCITKATQLVTTVSQGRFRCTPRTIGGPQNDDATAAAPEASGSVYRH
jgi:hypothetical protein